jgi:DNA-binding transcriptional ArsR family regulator
MIKHIYEIAGDHFNLHLKDDAPPERASEHQLPLTEVREKMTQKTEARIEQLPSSAKAVFSLLGDGKPRTLNEMVGSVSFSPRTIRNALNRLKEKGLIVAKFNFRDARKPLYQLKVA